jgi:hypothetical protein
MRVKIDYTNWRGVRSTRLIQPIEIRFEENEWHKPAQWLLIAIDHSDRNYQEKGFAMKNIHSWEDDAQPR